MAAYLYFQVSLAEDEDGETFVNYEQMRDNNVGRTQRIAKPACTMKQVFLQRIVARNMDFMKATRKGRRSLESGS